MRSASLGPPKSALMASGERVVFGGGALGSAALAEEFSTLHLRSSFIAGVIAMMAEF